MSSVDDHAQAGIASLALTRAEEAHTKLDGHEDLCAERFAHIHTAIGGVTSSVSTILKILAWGGTTLFGLLIAMLAFLGARTMSTNDTEVEMLRGQIERLEQNQRVEQSRRIERATRP